MLTPVLPSVLTSRRVSQMLSVGRVVEAPTKELTVVLTEMLTTAQRPPRRRRRFPRGNTPWL
jgi:hypothetical protein